MIHRDPGFPKDLIDDDASQWSSSRWERKSKNKMKNGAFTYHSIEPSTSQTKSSRPRGTVTKPLLVYAMSERRREARVQASLGFLGVFGLGIELTTNHCDHTRC